MSLSIIKNNFSEVISDEVHAIFGEIVKQGQMQLIPHSETESFLIAGNFALQFHYEKNRLNLYYIDIDDRGELRSFNMLQYLSERIRKEDKAYRASSTMSPLQAMAKLTLACLVRDGNDLWSGKKDWLQDDERSNALPDDTMISTLRSAWGLLN